MHNKQFIKISFHLAGQNDDIKQVECSGHHKAALEPGETGIHVQGRIKRCGRLASGTVGAR